MLQGVQTDAIRNIHQSRELLANNKDFKIQRRDGDKNVA